jgi:hypothetical protein
MPMQCIYGLGKLGCVVAHGGRVHNFWAVCRETGCSRPATGDQKMDSQIDLLDPLQIDPCDWACSLTCNLSTVVRVPGQNRPGTPTV